LLDYFLEEFGEKYGVPVPELAPEVVAHLTAHEWPGNVRELKNVVERLIVRGRGGIVRLADLPGSMPGALRPPAPPAPSVGAIPSQGAPGGVRTPRPSTPQLFDRMISQRESFWSAVYLPFMARDLTRDDVRALIAAGLQHTRGNYKMLLSLFNMEPADYKRFLNFLRKHQCHMPFQHFRTLGSTKDEVSVTIG
jgi:DNA-binding NtrC family response regulator